MADTYYQPFFCEENIWHLAKQRQDSNGEVVFISNLQKQVLFYQQKNAEDKHPQLWDYHVVYLEDKLIYDQDSRLDNPCPLRIYLTESFESRLPLLAPMFRLVTTDDYLRIFSSDRRHMKRHGQWLKDPPPWPCIGNGTHNLDAFTDMTRTEYGRILTLDEMSVG